jgi:hypothetical protein
MSAPRDDSQNKPLRVLPAPTRVEKMVYALEKDYLLEARACWVIVEENQGLELGDDEQIAGFLTLRGIIQEAEL